MKSEIIVVPPSEKYSISNNGSLLYKLPEQLGIQQLYDSTGKPLHFSVERVSEVKFEHGLPSSPESLDVRLVPELIARGLIVADSQVIGSHVLVKIFSIFGTQTIDHVMEVFSVRPSTAASFRVLELPEGTRGF